MKDESRRTAAISVVGQEGLTEKIVKKIAEGGEANEWSMHKEIAALFGLDYMWKITQADLAAMAGIAGNLKDEIYGAEIGLAVCCVLNARLAEEKETYQDRSDWPGLIMALQSAGEQARETRAKFMSQKEAKDASHPIALGLKKLLDSQNEIRQSVVRSAGDRLAIGILEAENEQTEELMNELVVRGNTVIAVNREFIEKSDQSIGEIIRGERCGCRDCRNAEGLASYPFMAELLASQSSDLRNSGCGMLGERANLEDLEKPDGQREVEEFLSAFGINFPAGGKTIVIGPNDDPDTIQRKLREAFGDSL